MIKELTGDQKRMWGALVNKFCEEQNDPDRTHLLVLALTLQKGDALTPEDIKNAVTDYCDSHGFAGVVAQDLENKLITVFDRVYKTTVAQAESSFTP